MRLSRKASKPTTASHWLCATQCARRVVDGHACRYSSAVAAPSSKGTCPCCRRSCTQTVRQGLQGHACQWLTCVSRRRLDYGNWSTISSPQGHSLRASTQGPYFTMHASRSSRMSLVDYFHLHPMIGPIQLSCVLLCRQGPGHTSAPSYQASFTPVCPWSAWCGECTPSPSVGTSHWQLHSTLWQVRLLLPVALSTAMSDGSALFTYLRNYMCSGASELDNALGSSCTIVGSSFCRMIRGDVSSFATIMGYADK